MGSRGGGRPNPVYYSERKKPYSIPFDCLQAKTRRRKKGEGKKGGTVRGGRKPDRGEKSEERESAKETKKKGLAPQNTEKS